LKHVARHDFQSFYNEELQFRNELNYPPFSRLAMAEFKARNETEASRHSLEFGKMLTRFGPGLLILGPAPAAIPRLKGLYRYHIIIKDLKSKDPSGKEIHRALGLAMHSYKSSDLGRSASVQCIVDVDPVGAM
jgi:primosomal protein N' (replication factor Y)